MSSFADSDSDVAAGKQSAQAHFDGAPRGRGRNRRHRTRMVRLRAVWRGRRHDLSKAVFPSLDPTASLLASLASFWAGLAARPLGAVICGMLGDRWGRRKLMPDHCLGDGRVVVPDGLAAHLPAGRHSRADVAGVAAYHPGLRARRRIDRRATDGSGARISQPARLVFRTAWHLLAAQPDSRQSLALHDGRPAFIGRLQRLGMARSVPRKSFVLVLLGIYIRRKVSETPAFEALKRRGAPVRAANPLGTVFRYHWRTALRLTLFFCGPAALFYLIVVFSLSYLTKHLGVPKQTGFMLLMVRKCLRDCLARCWAAI